MRANPVYGSVVKVGRARANPESGQSGTQTQERRIASLTQWPLINAASLKIFRRVLE